VIAVYGLLTVATVYVLRRLARSAPVPSAPQEADVVASRWPDMGYALAILAVMWASVTAYALLVGAVLRRGDLGLAGWARVAGRRGGRSSSTPSARCGRPTMCG